MEVSDDCSDGIIAAAALRGQVEIDRKSVRMAQFVRNISPASFRVHDTLFCSWNASCASANLRPIYIADWTDEPADETLELIEVRELFRLLAQATTA